MPPGVLGIEFEVVAGHLVLAPEVVYEQEVLPRMGNVVARGVTALPLTGVLIDLLLFPTEPTLQMVRATAEVMAETKGVGTRREQVAGMLEVASHTQLFLRLGLREPVFALYVVGFTLAGAEGGVGQ